jgi:hypothetical protein
MELWPFIPDTNMIEALEWATDVLPAKTTEQRIALRATPRQQFFMRHVFTPSEYARARTFAGKRRGERVLIPVWPEAVAVGNLESAQTVLPVDAAHIDLAAGDTVVAWQSDLVYELAEVDSVGAGTITLTEGLGAAYTRAMVAPVREARFLAPVTFSRGPHEWVECSPQFEVAATRDLADAELYPTYRSHPVVTDRAIVMQDASESIGREVEVSDSGLGLPVMVDVRELSGYQAQMAWFANGRPRLWALRQWLHYCRGRQRQFWLPTWNADMTLTATIGAADVVFYTGAIELVAPFDIQFLLTDGTMLRRRVVGGNGAAWELDSALGQEVTTADVEAISLLVAMRNDADRVEIQHLTARQADIAVPVVEVAP